MSCSLTGGYHVFMGHSWYFLLHFIMTGASWRALEIGSFSYLLTLSLFFRRVLGLGSLAPQFSILCKVNTACVWKGRLKFFFFFFFRLTVRLFYFEIKHHHFCIPNRCWKTNLTCAVEDIINVESTVMVYKPRPCKPNHESKLLKIIKQNSLLRTPFSAPFSPLS